MSSSPAPQCIAPRASSSAPKVKLPAGATDCHCHVFKVSADYPLVSARTYTPAPASLDEYLALCDTLGVDRTVQVNASVYGFDNTITLELIRSLGQHRARGVAGVPHDVSQAELERLHAGGMRGLRLSTHVQGYGGTEAIAALAPRIRPLGWHVQLHFDQVGEIASLEPQLSRADVPLVFDHLGGARGADGVEHPGFQALLRLLRGRDDCWVKISSWYRRSDAGSPHYDDMKPLAQALVDARPDRCLFGTNWPHPNLFKDEAMPDDGKLVDVFCDWVPDEETRKRIFVDNPAQLYGFPA